MFIAKGSVALPNELIVLGHVVILVACPYLFMTAGNIGRDLELKRLMALMQGMQ
jgi:hypothetical protein